MTPLQRRSALSHRTPISAPNGDAALREIAFEGKLILRGKPEAIGGAAESVLGAPLPTTAGGVAQGPKAMAQWLGPDEWLLVAPQGAEADILAALDKALWGARAQVVDVTDYYTTISLTGPRSREMLMKLATVDFDPIAFKAGTGVSTNFGRATAYARATAPDAFALVARISMADYLWCALAEAGREFGVPRQAPKGGKVKLHLPHFEEPTGGSVASVASLDMG